MMWRPASFTPWLRLAAVGAFVAVATVALAPRLSGAQNLSQDDLSKACRNGNGGACFNLGAALSADPRMASRAQTAFIQGCFYRNRDSCFNAGAMYETGQGSSKNDDDAYRNYDSACALGDAEGCKRKAALALPDLPEDPIDPAYVPQIEAFMTLPNMADGLTYVPGSLAIEHVRHSLNDRTQQWVTFKFQVVQKWDQKQVSAGRAIMFRNGRPSCQLRPTSQRRNVTGFTCVTTTYDTAEAARLAGDQEVRSHLPMDQRDKAWAQASDRHEPGSALTAADKACLHERRDVSTSTEMGSCNRVGTLNGQQTCTGYGTNVVQHVAVYEKNICKRPIAFRTMCGSTAFESFTVKPGEEIRTGFGPPCYWAY